MDNVIIFPTPKPAYRPGVVPFDVNIPEHVEAWNALFAMGWAAQEFREKQRRERNERTDMEVVR